MSATKTRPKPKPSQKGILIKVPTDEHRVIRMRCFEDGDTLAAWVRDAIKRKLASKPSRRNAS